MCLGLRVGGRENTGNYLFSLKKGKIGVRGNDPNLKSCYRRIEHHKYHL